MPLPVNPKVLTRLQRTLAPEVYSQVEEQLRARAVDDNQNQNQNQGGTEELAQLKPDVLKELTMGLRPGDLRPGEEQMDNQNQNQGKLAELMKLKPEMLRQLRVGLRGEQAMDNQNQNQGKQPE
jgi:hypothetical protein